MEYSSKTGDGPALNMFDYFASSLGIVAVHGAPFYVYEGAPGEGKFAGESPLGVDCLGGA